MKTAVLDIGGTAIKSGMYEEGTLFDLKEFPTNAKMGGDHVLKTAIEILKDYSEFERIGISTAGQVDSLQGIIKYANSNIPGYTGMRIKDILEQEFQVPVAVENDVNAAALGEAHFGAGRKYRDFLCLTYGTGVGGAIVMNGAIYRGATFSAGEMGAILIHPEDRNIKEDLFSGCYEKYASTTALINKVMQIDPSLTDGKKVFANIERDEIATAVDHWIDEIVYGITSLIHIFNPSCMILGGGVMKQNYIIDRIREKTDQNIMESYRDLVILQAQLGNMAGLYGATSIF